MSEQRIAEEAAIDRIPEAEIRATLKALARADRAVREFEEPRQGADFDGKWKHWQRTYKRAVDMGAKIEGEG